MRHRTSYGSTPFLGGADQSALTIICKWKSDTCATSKSLWKAPPVDDWWNDCLLSLPCLRKSPALHLMVSRSLFHGIVDPWCITNILWMTNNPSDLKHNSAGDSRWTMLRKTREDLHARRDWASLCIYVIIAIFHNSCPMCTSIVASVRSHHSIPGTIAWHVELSWWGCITWWGDCTILILRERGYSQIAPLTPCCLWNSCTKNLWRCRRNCIEIAGILLSKFLQNNNSKTISKPTRAMIIRPNPAPYIWLFFLHVILSDIVKRNLQRIHTFWLN